MKRIKISLTILLALVMCVLTALPTYAATPVMQDGITLTVTPDKNEYSQDEIINATVKVENANDFAVTNVSLEGISPEGYGLEIGENDSLTIGTLAAGSFKEISVSFVPITEGEKIYETDLELSEPFVNAYHDNVIEWIVEPGNEDNKVIRFFRNNEKDFHIDLLGINTDYDYVVYDFDVKLLNAAETYFVVQLKDSNSKYSQLCKIANGGVVATQGENVGTTLENNIWYNIAVAYDYADRLYSIYIDGELVKDDIAIEANFGDASIASLLRFYCPSLKDILGTEVFDVSDHNAEFLIDNVRVYKGTKPCAELVESEVEIQINPEKSIFTDAYYNGKHSTSQYDEMLEGYISLHTRNGMVYKDGAKTLLDTKPVVTENGYLVAVEELCTVLNIEYTVDTATNKVTINGREANGNKIATITAANGQKTAIDAQYFFEEILGLTVSIDEEAKSDGMMIAGASAFNWPTETWDSSSVFTSRTALQNLNDYLLFERPTASVILTTYESSEVKGEHPRIQATASDFDRIKDEVKSNMLMSTWYQQLITAADYLVEESTEALKYELRDGVRLLQVSRDMLDHMYTLGMAYQLTGDTKYVDRAWVDLYAVSTFKDWHPEHDLDPAEMSAAVAIGYDWMYDALNERQREIIEKGIYKNCFFDATTAYQSTTGKLGGNVLTGMNHNIVLNGGFAMGAMAFMDVYPEVSSYILSGAIRAADIMLTEYGPDGAWKEGPGYWEYATQYTTKMLSSLENVFGTCFSLDVCEGLNTAANYMLNLQSDQGIFNYGDGVPGNYYVPELFYLSNKYGDDNITSAVLQLNHGKMLDNENVVLSLLWYNTDIQEGVTNMPLDDVYRGEGVAAFRDAWTDGVTTYVAIHGGKTQICHAQIDAGTFVYDYAGIRWAKELGNTPYDTTVTAQYGVDGKRWLLYRSRAEAHNTIVINPDNSAGQVIDSTAYLTRFESDNKGGIAVLDMTENYAENASSAIRGFFFTDDRTSLVVRDEISLLENDSTIYWFMQTDAAVDISEDGKTATLTQAGKQVTLEFLTSGTVGEAVLSVGPSTRMTEYSTSPITGGSTSSTSDTESPDVNRIAIKLTGANGDVAITTKLTPVGVNSTSVETYNTSIASWQVPEGEIASKPEVQKVVIDGREVKFDSANQAMFLCVEGKYDSVPEAIVTVDESKYTCEVVNATTIDGGTTAIFVKDKENENIYTVYNVNLIELPVAVVPDGYDNMTALQVIGAEASAEPQADQGYVAWKTLDQDTSSRWTSQGLGNWILFELEEAATVDNLLILFKNGHVRFTYFNVSVSMDGVNYQQVYSGKSGGTAIGSEETYEKFELGSVTAKYIKIGCNGNSAQGMTAGWNNIGEVVFTGTVINSGETPTPTPGEGEEPTPTPGTGETTTPTPDASQDVVIIVESTDLDYTKNNNETVTIHCTGEYDELVGVDMDGKEVDASNYTVTEGSTIVQFKKEYLETLSTGEHTITLRYTDGRSVDSKLTITEKLSDSTDNNKESTPEDNDNNGNEDANKVENTTVLAISEQAETGDDSNIWLCIILLVAAMCGAITLGVVYRRKLKGVLTLLLACVMLASMGANALDVHAEGTSPDNTKTITATESVMVGENTVNIGFSLTYSLSAEEPGTSQQVLCDLDFTDNSCVQAWNGASGQGFTSSGANYEISGTMKFTGLKSSSTQAQMDMRWDKDAWADATSTSDMTGKYIVYEFDFRIPENVNSTFFVQLRYHQGSTRSTKTMFKVVNNVLQDGNSNAVTDSLETNQWYSIALKCNYATGKYDLYLGDVPVLSQGLIPSDVMQYVTNINDLVRFIVKANDTTTQFEVDNFKVYEDEYTDAAPTPVITINTQPIASEVRTGEKTTLTIAANATENAEIAYQWYSCTDADKTGAEAISGATNATYEVTLTEAGTVYYYCKASAEGAESVDSDVVAVTATAISFTENFDADGFKTIAWSGVGATDGIAISVASSGYAVVADETDSTDKELSILGTATGNVDARFSDDESWADSTSTSDLSLKKLVYEFDLKIKENATANFEVLLRSIASNTQLSRLCKVENNVLKLTNATETKALATGEYTITIACDFTTGKQDVYVNNVALKKDVAMHNFEAFNEQKVNDLLRFTVSSGSVYALDNIKVYEGDYTGEIVETPAPVITINTQPDSPTVEVGAEAILMVAASATENADVAYQWYSCTDANKADAEAINGATQSTYRITPMELGTTYYYCEVSAEGAENVTSNVVAVKADKKVLCDLDFTDNSCVQAWSGASGQGFTSSGANYEISGTMKFKGLTSSGTQAQMDMRWDKDAWADKTSTSDMTGKYVVYEFDFMIPENVASTFSVQLRYHQENTRSTVTMFKIDNNVLKNSSNTAVLEGTLSTNQWHSIAMKCNYATGKYDLYLGDSAVISQGNIPTNLNTYVTHINDLVRFIVAANDTTTQFEVDNFKVYECEVPTTLE